jgi:hypothetical protein
VKVTALAVLLVASPVLAEPVRVPEQPAEVELDGWEIVAPPEVPDPPALVLRHPDGALAAVTVAMAPNPDAWVDKKRRAYLKAIVAGFEALPGVDVASSKASKVEKVPCLDLALVRDGKAVAVRLLLFRTRTIAMAVEGGMAEAVVGLTPAAD